MSTKSGQAQSARTPSNRGVIIRIRDVELVVNRVIGTCNIESGQRPNAVVPQNVISGTSCARSRGGRGPKIVQGVSRHLSHRDRASVGRIRKVAKLNHRLRSANGVDISKEASLYLHRVSAQESGWCEKCLVSKYLWKVVDSFRSDAHANVSSAKFHAPWRVGRGFNAFPQFPQKLQERGRRGGGAREDDTAGRGGGE